MMNMVMKGCQEVDDNLVLGNENDNKCYSCLGRNKSYHKYEIEREEQELHTPISTSFYHLGLCIHLLNSVWSVDVRKDVGSTKCKTLRLDQATKTTPD